MSKSEIDWTFDNDIPTMSFFEDVNLDGSWDLEEVVDNFKFAMKTGTFLNWEAVILEEQDLPLCEQHEEALEQLLNFGDEDDEILYINDLPRYDQPWYEILWRIVPHLLIDLFDPSAAASHDENLLEAWPDLYRCVEEHGRSLSLPEGVTTPTQVIDPLLQHRLWLVLFRRACRTWGTRQVEARQEGATGTNRRIPRPFARPQEHCRVPEAHRGQAAGDAGSARS